MEGFGKRFGALGGSWGASWAVLAASWGVLAASWAVLGRHGSIFVVLSSTGSPTRGDLGNFGLPIWHPKMRPKTEQHRRQKRRRKKTLFKIVLKRSWSHLGSFGEPSWGRRMGFRPGETAFRENQRFCKKKVSRGDLVPNLGQIGRPKGSKMEDKREPRRSKKREEK